MMEQHTSKIAIEKIVAIVFHLPFTIQEEGVPLLRMFALSDFILEPLVCPSEFSF